MRKLSKVQLKNIVAFCALMQNSNGIIGKSPDYIEEKFTRYCLSKRDESEWGLDTQREALVAQWVERWMK